ncbi:MAG: aldose 1-epimerase family protein [Clostridia bacterium]|nr:aldose 1-epimerase family protein [Clostridia bacterium]
MNKYIGQPLQLYGVEEMRLVGGKGDGMRILNVRNDEGLQFVISLDRCGDISRLSFKGDNFGYFSPCGYVSPQYYDGKGKGFLKSFTAGFFTTCGLTAVGKPCTDNGVELPLHGTISNTPCESYAYWSDCGVIHIKLMIRDAAMCSHKLLLEREYICSIHKNVLTVKDRVKNIGYDEAPFEILYHCNMGYPLLSENAVLKIPSTEVKPRNEHAAEGIENCLIMEPPQRGYEEKCYYHTMNGKTKVSIFNPDIGKGLNIRYDASALKCFTEWKMMGEYEYVLGLEPGNCLPDGRDVMRKTGMLEIIKPEETREYSVTFEFTEDNKHVG